MQYLSKRENRAMVGFISIVAVAANIALFIMSMFEVATAFEQVTVAVLVALIISGVIIASSIIFGVAFYIKKRKINKKYGKF